MAINIEEKLDDLRTDLARLLAKAELETERHAQILDSVTCLANILKGTDARGGLVAHVRSLSTQMKLVYGLIVGLFSSTAAIFLLDILR